MAANKKITMAAVFILVMALLLAACGGGNNGAGSSNGENTDQQTEVGAQASGAPDTESQSVEAVTSLTHLYTDSSGREVEIPSKPERIVAHFYAPEMVSLGVPMVGTNHANAKLVLTEEQLQGVQDIGAEGSATPSLEKVLSLEPDIIIVPDFLDATALEGLSKIAPTVTMNYSGDVFSRITALGDIIGKQEAAADWIKSYEAKAAEKRAELASVVGEGETASAFVVFQDKLLYIYGPQRLGPTMYDALGFKAPEAVQELFAENPDKLWLAISQETLPELAGDHIFLVTQDTNEASREGVEELTKSAIWQSLPAVKNGQAYVVGNRFAFNDSVTLEWLLEEMPKVFLK